MGKFVNRSLSYIIQIIAYCLILAKSDDIMIWAMEKHSGFFAWQSSYWLDLAIVLGLLVFGVSIFKRVIKRNLHISISAWLLIVFLIVLYVKCRFFGTFQLIQLTPFKCWQLITCVDLFMCGGVAIAYVAYISGVKCRHSRFVHIRKRLEGTMGNTSNNSENESCVHRKPILDTPITNKDEDQLDYQRWAVTVADEILSLKPKKTYSYGIVGEWGIGKTSFINLLRKELQKSGEEIELIDFNPRNSSDYGHIQEDFLMTFCNTIKKHNSKFSFLTSRYLKALRIDKRIDIIASLLDLVKTSDVRELRGEICQNIRRLQRKIIVFIDDLDRMGREEIIEVFKLINCNASFPNTIFVTAYDKAQINRILSSHLGEDVISGNVGKESVLYSEKYFNRELRLVIPSGKIHVFFKELVSQDIILKHYILDKETTCLQSVIDQNFTNVRDLKKFVNQLAEIEEWRWDEVVKTELILLQIIRYKYNDEYSALRNRIGLSEEQIHGQIRQYYIKDLEKEQPEGIKTILQSLLSKDAPYTYEEMKTACSYYNYFIDVPELFFKWSEMESLFNLNLPLKNVEDYIRNNLIRKEEQLRAITTYHLWKDKNALEKLPKEEVISSFQRDIQILFCCSCVFCRDTSLKQLYDGLLEEELCNNLLSTSQECAYDAMANYQGDFAYMAKEYLKKYELQIKMKKLKEERSRQIILK